MGLGGISLTQLVVILAIVLVVFGTKRVKTLGTDLGGAINGFRRAMNAGDGTTLGNVYGETRQGNAYDETSQGNVNDEPSQGNVNDEPSQGAVDRVALPRLIASPEDAKPEAGLAAPLDDARHG